ISNCFCRWAGGTTSPSRSFMPYTSSISAADQMPAVRSGFAPRAQRGIGGDPMTAIDFAAMQLSDDEHRVQLRRAIVASTIGTAIEWYDFFLYSTVTGLVFAKLFFPLSDPLVGTLEAFAIYAVGFIARPIGAAIFGHYGDRIGRKATLIATLMLMGVATF